MAYKYIVKNKKVSSNDSMSKKTFLIELMNNPYLKVKTLDELMFFLKVKNNVDIKNLGSYIAQNSYLSCELFTYLIENNHFKKGDEDVIIRLLNGVFYKLGYFEDGFELLVALNSKNYYKEKDFNHKALIKMVYNDFLYNVLNNIHNSDNEIIERFLKQMGDINFLNIDIFNPDDLRVLTISNAKFFYYIVKQINIKKNQKNLNKDEINKLNSCLDLIKEKIDFYKKINKNYHPIIEKIEHEINEYESKVII